MPTVGDVVIYGTGGVCRIRDKKEECFGGTPREYYILERLSDKDHTTIFVPVDNAQLIANMQRVLSPDEWEDLRKTLTPFPEAEWPRDGRGKAKRMNELLTSADRVALVRLILTVGAELSEHGKLTAAEENNCLRAASMLYGELSLVFVIGRDEVIPYLLGRIELSCK